MKPPEKYAYSSGVQKVLFFQRKLHSVTYLSNAAWLYYFRSNTNPLIYFFKLWTNWMVQNISWNTGARIQTKIIMMFKAVGY
jgi:hypothetical protein